MNTFNNEEFLFCQGGVSVRYTRYDYKKNGMIKAIISIAVVIVVTVTCGLFIINFIFKGNEIPSIKKTQEETNQVENTTNSNTQDAQKINASNIIALQCGYYSKKENAENEVASLASYCNSFIIEDEGKYRVIAGIYNEETGAKKIEEFKSQGIEVAKVNLGLENNTDDDKKINEIINSFLDITYKFDDSSIKSINTSEFKSWCDTIINDGNDDKSDKLLKVQEYVKNLPDELEKNTALNGEEQLYTIIKA